MRFGTIGRAAVVMAASAVVLGGAASPMPTVADVQAKFAEGSYADTIVAASRILSASGATAPSSADKAEVFQIKADAHLHLKQYSSAQESYAKAAKLATDPTAIAKDAAMAELLKQSHAGAYTPKHPGSDGAKPSPIDVTADADRKTALTDLFEDEFAAATPKLKAAENVKSAGSMPTLQSAMDALLLLHEIELTATGADTKTRAEVDAVSKTAHDVLGSAVKSLDDRVEQIKTAADATSTAPGRRPNQKVGVSTQNVSELQSIIANATTAKQLADKFDTSRTAATAGSSGSSASTASAATAATGDDAAGGGATPAAGASDSSGSGGDLSDVITEAEKVITDAQALIAERKTNGAAGQNGYGRNGATGTGTGTGARRGK